MLIKPDCIPCILNMAVTSVRKLSLDEIRFRSLFSRILRIPSLRGESWEITSPQVIESVMKLIVDETGDPDPFRAIKADQNKRIMEIVPFLRKILSEAPDPLYLAVKLAILGNTIDLMMGDRPTDIENFITERLKAPLDTKAYLDFREKLESCNSLVYLGDNAGEIVFDKLLVALITQRHDMDAVFIVRSVPALNDATMDEAKSIGLDKVIRVIENGINGPCPGTLLDRCSAEVSNIMAGADMIISKGGGNFDALEGEQPEIRDKISFMLLSKCQPYCEYFCVRMHEPILAHLENIVK